jgi:hypothetical protein
MRMKQYIVLVGGKDNQPTAVVLMTAHEIRELKDPANYAIIDGTMIKKFEQTALPKLKTHEILS